MLPEDFHQLKAFQALIEETIADLKGIDTQSKLSNVAPRVAAKWKPIDADFAKIISDLGEKAWQLRFAQVTPTLDAVIGHLEQQKAAVSQQLGGR